MDGWTGKMKIHFTDYLQYRAKTRGFDLDLIADILRYSSERYYDTETRRSIVVGKHLDKLVVIPYEQSNSEITPITIHTTSRQQIKFRLQTGRITHE
jgi:hypothetical protein